MVGGCVNAGCLCGASSITAVFELVPQKSDLLSLARSLLQAWADPLLFLSSSASTLPQPAQSNVSNKIQELKQHSKILGDGLDVLSNRVGAGSSLLNVRLWYVLTLFLPPPPPLHLQMGQAAQAISSLPYSGGNDLGQDKISRLVNFHFLLSCFRRDSHKIDSFLKVLRCRMANMLPEMC